MIELVFFISPLLALNLILINGCLKKDLSKLQYILLALILGIIGYFSNPFKDWDLNQHYIMFKRIKDYKNWDEFVKHFLSWKNDYIYIVYYYLKNIMNEKIIGAFSMLIFNFSLVFYTIKSTKYNNLLEKSFLIKASIILFLSFGIFPFWFFSGVRFPIALGMFILGNYYQILKRDKKFYIYYIISTLFHFSMFLPITIIVVIFRLKEKVIKKINIILFLIPLKIILGYISEIFLRFGYRNIYNRYIEYFYGKWSILGFSNVSNYKVSLISLVYFFILYLISYKIKGVSRKIRGIYLFCLIFSLKFLTIPILFERYTRSFIGIYIFFMTYILSKTKNNLLKYGVIFINILFALLHTWLIRKHLIVFDEKIIIVNIFYILKNI